MGNFGSIQTAIIGRTGVSGDAYTDDIKRAINWAQREICTVAWQFLYTTGTIAVSAAGGTTYTLPTGFNRLYKVFIDNSGTPKELIKGTPEDIDLNPPSSSGMPLYYSVSSQVTSSKKIMIGCPTADDDYTVTIGYYQFLSDLVSDSTTSQVSSAYKDSPLITGGTYKFLLDLEQTEASQIALAEFMRDMSVMESVVPHYGPGYSAMIQQESKD